MKGKKYFPWSQLVPTSSKQDAAKKKKKVNGVQDVDGPNYQPSGKKRTDQSHEGGLGRSKQKRKKEQKRPEVR